MKTIKRSIAFMLALVLTFAMSVTAFADEAKLIALQSIVLYLVTLTRLTRYLLVIFQRMRQHFQTSNGARESQKLDRIH